MENIPQVYKAICDVQAKMAEVGISKAGRNREQNYAFRGIDQVYDALAPILAKNNLSIIPRVLDRLVTERTTRSGSIQFNVAVRVEFDLCSAVDGSHHVACTWGEASDSADKATNKAMSAAYKYMAFQLFCIPLEAMDADETTPEPVYNQVPPAAAPAASKPKAAAAKPAATTAPASAPAAGKKVSTRSTMFTPDELEELDNDISVAIATGNDKTLHEISILLGVERAWIGDTLRNMVVMCLSGRVHTVKEPQLKGFEATIDGFAKLGIITADDGLGIKNNTRSVLNLDLIKK